MFEVKELSWESTIHSAFLPKHPAQIPRTNSFEAAYMLMGLSEQMLLSLLDNAMAVCVGLGLPSLI